MNLRFQIGDATCGRASRPAHFVELWLILLIAAMTGCGGGVERYGVSGAVTLDGKPVPGGEIMFEADRTKGGSGPRGYAKIKDGRYETLPDRGVLGGPYLAIITATDGNPRGELMPLGAPLLREPVRLDMDLPKKDCERDINVPHQTK